MEKLKVRQKRNVSLAVLILSFALLITGILIRQMVLVDIGSVLLIIPIYFVFDYILAVVRNQFKIRDELLAKMGTIESGMKKMESAVLKNREILVNEMNALLSVYSCLGEMKAPLTVMRGYTLDPEAGILLISQINEKKPQNYLDIGSGLSTLLAGYTARKLNRGHVWSLEHHPDYYQLTESWIRQHNLEDWVTLIHAPLKEYTIGEKTWLWYDLSLIPDNKAFEMILVDGPPGNTQEFARYPALPLIKDRINAHATLLVDDADRPDEQAIIEKWQAEFPGLRKEQVLTKKGMVVLTFL